MVTIKKKPEPPGGKKPQLSDFSVEDILARVIWGEAEGEGDDGMQAVGNVIMNRVDVESKYDADAENIVMARAQFSSIDDPVRLEAMMNLTNDNPEYIQALEISKKLLTGEMKDITGGATHFYNPNTANMDEEWIKKYPVTFKLKNHWFAKGAF